MPGLSTSTAKTKHLASGLVALFMLGLSACGGDQSDKADPQTDLSQNTEVTTEQVLPALENETESQGNAPEEAAPPSNAVVDKNAQQIADLAFLKFHRAHPKACYERFHSTWDKREIDKAFQMLTPVAQQQIAGIVLSLLNSAEPVPEDAPNPHDFVYDGRSERGSGVAIAISNLLGKHGINSVDQLYEDLWPDDFDKLTKEEQDVSRREAFYKAASAVGPPDAFVKDVLQMINELKRTESGIKRTLLIDGLRITKHELIEVEIEKKRALGWYAVPGREKQYSIGFVHDEMGWQIDQIMPYSYNVPGIGYYRDTAGIAHPK